MKRFVVVAAMVLLVAGLLLAGGLWWRQVRVKRFVAAEYGEPGERVVAIPPGANVGEVALLLVENGVVSDAELFRRAARLHGADRALKAGEYGFKCPVTPGKVLDVLTSGKVKLYAFTVAEGLRTDEVAHVVEAAGLGKAADLVRMARDGAFARSLGVPARSLEGYLFPDTYSFPRAPKPEAVLRRMVERYREEYRKANAQRKAGVSLNEHEAVTLASIIEKETGDPSERPRISCVFHNRLRTGMRLGTDPTVIYAMILRDGFFNGNLKHSDLLAPHPYNTYLNKGLPPGPIANPGGAALAAALAPIDCDDLFFVSKGNGSHAFSRTYEEHERNIARYQLRGRPSKGI